MATVCAMFTGLLPSLTLCIKLVLLLGRDTSCHSLEISRRAKGVQPPLVLLNVSETNHSVESEGCVCSHLHTSSAV